MALTDPIVRLYNYDDLEMFERAQIFHNNFIIDETLREGEQTPNIAFNIFQKEKILQKLIEAEIKHIEIGILGASEKEYSFFNKCIKTYKNIADIYITSLCREEDLKIVSVLNPKNWFIIIPTSENLIKIKFGFNYTQYLQYLTKFPTRNQ